MTDPKPTFLAKAETHWGPALPDEVREFALYADQYGAGVAAKAIGYTAAVASGLLANKYGGDLPTVFAKIRGALMGEVVGCPVLGEIGRDHCLSEQKKPFATSNSARARVYRACRSGCPHSRLKEV